MKGNVIQALKFLILLTQNSALSTVTDRKFPCKFHNVSEQWMFKLFIRLITGLNNF